MDVVGSLTEQLRAFSSGDRKAAEAVLREILPKLHELAVRCVRKERYVAPVSPTELIHEVWLRHIHKGGWQIKDREHFYAIAGCAMRRVLVDLARSRLALKRGALEGGLFVDPSKAEAVAGLGNPEQIVEIGLLMERLGEAHPRSLPIVDMHYFAGFSFDEIAGITGLTPRQVRHLWNKGRDWLKDRMAPPDRAQSAARTARHAAAGATDRTPAPSKVAPPIPR